MNHFRTATISPCGQFRYLLGRRWADGGRVLLFVMLNPSTADANVDDKTIARCTSFAQQHGFNAFMVVNLFAFRATKPRDLWLAADPVGPENDAHIALAATAADEICLAYGSIAGDHERVQQVLPLLRRPLADGQHLQCLHITKTGFPGHPLYLAGTSRLKAYTLEAIHEAMHGAAA